MGVCPFVSVFVCSFFQISSLIVAVGFGRCTLPAPQVALLGIFLIATTVYLRWKDTLVLDSDSSQKLKHVSPDSYIFFNADKFCSTRKNSATTGFVRSEPWSLKNSSRPKV